MATFKLNAKQGITSGEEEQMRKLAFMQESETSGKFEFRTSLHQVFVRTCVLVFVHGCCDVIYCFLVVLTNLIDHEQLVASIAHI